MSKEEKTKPNPKDFSKYPVFIDNAFKTYVFFGIIFGIAFLIFWIVFLNH